MKQPRRDHVSLRRDYPARVRPRVIDPAIRSLQPMVFFADASELDVSTLHVFADPDIDGIAYGFVTGCGTVNVKLTRRLAR